MPRTRARTVLLTTALVLLSALAASAALTVLDATYHPDRMLPEFNGLWTDDYFWGDAYPASNVGGGLCVFLGNTGTSSVSISDVKIGGQSLTNEIDCSEGTMGCGFYACTYEHNPTLVSAGLPVWWRADPTTVAAGKTAEVFVRMRNRVATTLTVQVVTSAGNVTTSVVVTTSDVPKIANYGLSSDSSILYLYLKHPTKGYVPSQILIDNVDRTANCTMAGDSDIDIVAVKCTLASAFTRGTYHTFQAVYSDGSKASDGLRVYRDNWKYGTWGYCVEGEEEAWWTSLKNHSMNIGRGAPASTAEMNAFGFGVIKSYGGAAAQYGIALCDEIEHHETNANIPDYCAAQVGALSQGQSNSVNTCRASYSQYPTILNMDGSFKPYNYYTYGHVADIQSIDPYYSERICDTYWFSNTKEINTMPFYRKATYIEGVCATCKAACEPHPMHAVLCITRRQYKNDQGVQTLFRYATPEEKRIEVYYAVGAGAKQIDYWWTSPQNVVNFQGHAGLAALDEPQKTALWREVGLLGAEMGLAGDVIVNSSPASFKIDTTGKLWVRALVSNVDTIALLCVNEDYWCNDDGTVIRSIKDAEVSFDLPSWLTSPTSVYEVSYKGISDVSNSVASGRITLSLGRVDVSRLIIITKDANLRSGMQTAYTDTYGPRVDELIPN